MEIFFDDKRSLLENQFCQTEWLENTGLSIDALKDGVKQIEKSNKSKALIKAKTFEYIVLCFLILPGYNPIDIQRLLPYTSQRYKFPELSH